MPTEYAQMKTALRSLRWKHLLMFFAYLFVIACVTEWKVFSSSGFKVGIAASLSSFSDLALYALVMVPFVTLILLLLRKAGTLESRKIGLRIGSIFRSHADISRTANPGE